ncbi:hypothetical protein DWB78_06050 [Halopelagius longus]|uniref:Uncharacterized protein n=1 Tax=Halopelagius longus TaxID=1236180 RepID=A0A370ISF7_9EURY|nr:hypothetical protein DWB78_06050 [Halopelagius longus]
MSEITRSPPVLGSSLALVAATVALLSATLASQSAIAPAAAGVLLLGVGLYRASRRLVTLGSAALFVSVLLAGVRGAPPEPLLLAALGTVLAWDTADNALGVGEQLGRETDTSRLVVVHAATTLLVGVFGAAVCYAVYLAAGGGQPVSAVVLLLLGTVALVSALRGSGESGRTVRRGR